MRQLKMGLSKCTKGMYYEHFAKNGNKYKCVQVFLWLKNSQFYGQGIAVRLAILISLL